MLSSVSNTHCLLRVLQDFKFSTMKQRNLTITLLILLAQFLFVQAQYNDCCSAEFLDQFTSNSIEINLENRGPATIEACGIQSENAVWISFVSDGNPLELKLTLLNPSNQEMRIALLENCYNEVNCNLIPMTNTVTFSSGALTRYQQYYINPVTPAGISFAF